MKGSRVTCLAMGLTVTMGCASDDLTRDELGEFSSKDAALESYVVPEGATNRPTQCFKHFVPKLLSIVPRGAPITREDGTEAIFDVSLRIRPRSVVTLLVTVSDPTEANVEPNEIEITPKDWWRPRRVIVRGVSDLLADGAVPFEVIVAPQSSDPLYARMAPAHLPFVNQDAAAFALIGDLAGGDFLSSAQDVNSDGSVVVGYGTSDRGREALKWTAAAGPTSLASAPSTAYRVNRTGSVMVGKSLDSANRAHAAVWRDGAGPQLLPYDDEEAFVRSTSTAVSGDGLVIGGSLKPWGYAETRGVLWQGTLLTELPATPSGLNEDGSVWVGSGTYFKASSNHFPLRSGVKLPFATSCLTDILCDAQAFDVSGDGRFVVGYSRVPAEYSPDPSEDGRTRAVLWDTAKETVSTLSSQQDATALAVDGNGRVVVGYAKASAAESTTQAMRWLDGTEKTIAALLDSAGVDRRGWQLTQANAVSEDGRVIVGDAVDSEGHASGWIAVLP
ncbi:MAG: hypothetical protein QM784_18695 [Polyangiaceae bacterium]